MATGKVIDFDEWRAERASRDHEEGAPPTVVVGGKSYALPRELPAALALDIVRLKRTDGEGADVPAEALFSIGDQLFGPDTFRAILVENALGVLEMGDLITEAFRAYGADEEDATVPNPEAPEEGPTTTEAPSI